MFTPLLIDIVISLTDAIVILIDIRLVYIALIAIDWCVMPANHLHSPKRIRLPLEPQVP